MLIFLDSKAYAVIIAHSRRYTAVWSAILKVDKKFVLCKAAPTFAVRGLAFSAAGIQRRTPGRVEKDINRWTLIRFSFILAIIIFRAVEQLGSTLRMCPHPGSVLQFMETNFNSAITRIKFHYS
jgi:hypothetical protein